jgi:SAM-dependent methyltransferase
MTPVDDTRDSSYAARLKTKESVWWKRLLNVQAPYQWNLRRQRLGRTLDVGCGIGRNLVSLDAGSIGVDHNEASVAEARARGFAALTVDEWEKSPQRRPESFDSILLAHVIEHMDAETGREVLAGYLPYLRPGGKVFFICPQERGYTTDATHVRFTDGDDLTALAREAGLRPEKWFSFPLPRRAGRFFTYNEFCLLAHKPG